MRTLDPILAARLTKSINNSAVTVTIDDRHAGIHRPRWTTLLTDTVPDGPAAVGLAYDGAFLRARIDPVTHKLHAQRVTDPTSTAQWAAWTELETLVATTQIALAWDGNAKQFLFWHRTNGAIKVRESADNGATWGAAVNITTLTAGPCTAMAATLNGGSGTVTLFYAVNVPNAPGAPTPTTTRIYHTSRDETSGSWTTPAECLGWWITPDPPAAVRGLAIDGAGDTLNVVTCYDNSLHTYPVPSATPTTWPQPTVILKSDDPTRSCSYPSIAYNFDYMYALFFNQADTSAGTNTPHHLQAPTWDTWTATPRPHNIATAYGAHAAGSTTRHYLCTSAIVRHATRWDDADPTKRVDVSADTLALTLTEALDAPGELTLRLRNDDGRYLTDLPGSSAFQAIRRGSQITPRLGYTISGVDFQEYYRNYWITEITHNREKRRSHLVIKATDGWGVLYRATADRAHTWANQTIGVIITAILTGYGFVVTTDGAAAWDTTLPSFVIPPETPLGRPILHLLTIAGGHLIFRTNAAYEHHWPSATAHLFVPTLTPAYTVGADHPIYTAAYATRQQHYNHIRATNTQTNRQATDWTSIENDNQARTDARLDTRLQAAELQDLADNAIADQQRTTDYAEITIPPHPGIEIADTLTVQDTVISLDAPYLVISNTVTYDTADGAYTERLLLGHNS